MLAFSQNALCEANKWVQLCSESGHEDMKSLKFCVPVHDNLYEEIMENVGFHRLLWNFLFEVKYYMFLTF